MQSNNSSLAHRGYFLKLNMDRLGKILFNYSILGLLISLAPFLSLIIVALFAMVVVIIIFLTLFIIFLNQEFMNFIRSTFDSISTITSNLFNALPIICTCNIALSISSIILLTLSKNPHPARKVFAIINVVIQLIILMIANS